MADNVTRDWREMTEGRELDKLVAERLEGVPLTLIMAVEGGYLYRTGIDALDDTPWDVLWLYSSDLNAAITLFTDLDHDYTPRLVRLLVPKGSMTIGWKAAILLNDGYEEIAEFADTPALAICRAWLAYQDRKAGGHG